MPMRSRKTVGRRMSLRIPLSLRALLAPIRFAANGDGVCFGVFSSQAIVASRQEDRFLNPLSVELMLSAPHLLRHQGTYRV